MFNRLLSTLHEAMLSETTSETFVSLQETISSLPSLNASIAALGSQLNVPYPLEDLLLTEDANVNVVVENGVVTLKGPNGDIASFSEDVYNEFEKLVNARINIDMNKVSLCIWSCKKS